MTAGVSPAFHKPERCATFLVMIVIGTEAVELVAAVRYRAGVLVIRFFGSHAEYDRIDAETV